MPGHSFRRPSSSSRSSAFCLFQALVFARGLLSQRQEHTALGSIYPMCAGARCRRPRIRPPLHGPTTRMLLLQSTRTRHPSDDGLIEPSAEEFHSPGFGSRSSACGRGSLPASVAGNAFARLEARSSPSPASVPVPPRPSPIAFAGDDRIRLCHEPSRTSHRRPTRWPRTHRLRWRSRIRSPVR